MSAITLSKHIPADAQPIVSAMLTRLAALPGFVEFQLHYEDDFEIAERAATVEGIAPHLGACDMETLVTVITDDSGKRRKPSVVLIYSNGCDVISDHAIGPPGFAAAMNEVAA